MLQETKVLRELKVPDGATNGLAMHPRHVQ